VHKALDPCFTSLANGGPMCTPSAHCVSGKRTLFMVKKSGSLEKQPPGLKPEIYIRSVSPGLNPLRRTDARYGEVVRGWHNMVHDVLLLTAWL
jgi:hypothetical protein